jgi:hypothetical protein
MFKRATVALLLTAALILPILAFASPTLAAESEPQWTVTAVSRPTNFAPGDQTGDDAYLITVTNTGGASTDGSPITVTDELPEGLSLDPTGASGEDQLVRQSNPVGAKLTCVLSSCVYTGVVVPDDTITLAFPVDVANGFPSPTCPVAATAVGCVTNVVRVSGGGAPAASMQTLTTISDDTASFGISPGGATTALSTVQAGAHADLTTSIAFNTVKSDGELADDPKDTTDDLPPGFAGDLVDTPACPASAFLENQCPIPTQVGVAAVTLSRQVEPYVEPVYNLVSGPGEVAKLGFPVGATARYAGDVSVRPGDYGLETTFYNATAGIVELDQVSLTVWGVPADPIHDPLRALPGYGSTVLTFPGVSSDALPVPFLTNPTTCRPTDCDVAVCEPTSSEASFSADSWQLPEQYVEAHMAVGPLVGCGRLGMQPSLTAEATTSNASSATGLDVNMKLPQTYENSEGLATSTLKKAVVTLPDGMTVNPSAGAGLGACTPQQFTEEAVQFVPGKGCPNESKLGTVKIITPSLKEEATGSVFLAQPYDNPFDSLIALYVVARIPNRGVLVKLAGEVVANPVTGQLVTTFDTSDPSHPHAGLPPLPFSLFTFSFRQGATSPLVTPPTCGNYTVTATLTPWSDPEGTPLTPTIPPFPISGGAEGGTCPSGGTPPFNPQVTAGTENNDAGTYSPMDIRVTRNDGEQEITRFSAQLPPGLTANLSGVPFCPDADIERAKSMSGAQEEAESACPLASEIGHTIVGAGVGSVLAQAPGKVYMAGPYNGAPFSIVAITSAKVGPFDLGTVVVREALEINPETAAVTVDAKASDPIPHIIKGIVVYVRDIRVYINRPNFTLNPTNCDPLTFSATVDGAGADPANPADQVPVTIDDPFRVTACQALKFAPKFVASTSGKTSKANGASLTVKLSYPAGAQGTQANIKSVKVDLPLQLPSRLTTLQKACVDKVFVTNPAACPADSIVGHATAVTPILPVPLVGPAYFVSHGGAKFPELVVVLQGYGVTIELHGETFISKAGITSSTFRTVPDQPVTSFELTLPQGRDSALAAYGRLCSPTRTVEVRKKVQRKIDGHIMHVTKTVKETRPIALQMPTAFTAQNGLVIHQSTPISVTGCAKAKAHRQARPVATHKKKKGTK